MRTLILVTCLLALFMPTAAAADHLWCIDADDVHVEVDPISADIHVFHDSALYNCCPEPITYEVHFGDATMFVVEHVAADPPCDCNCCFDLGVKIHDPPPGPWCVTFSWLDEETGTWVEWHGQIVVPDVGQGYTGGEVEPENSGCLTTTGVQDPPHDQLLWGTLKTLYR